MYSAKVICLKICSFQNLPHAISKSSEFERMVQFAIQPMKLIDNHVQECGIISKKDNVLYEAM